jgi:transcriptional regulator with XRE-family HTH domain
MTELSYNKYQAMSDKAFAELIGDFVRHHRLQQNRTQHTLARDAGISRSTLSLLERGETVTLATLIQVLRVLEKLHVMEVFSVKQGVSPLALAKQQKSKRKRARDKNMGTTQKTDW